MLPFKFIEFTGHTHFNVIMFDVDSKDASVGISSPPRPFVSRDFLATVKQCLCPSTGKFFKNVSSSIVLFPPRYNRTHKNLGKSLG